ncbi:hypothetical protein CONLIGDRAFT_143996 [Coniochaeta ligniaria NRRL 30616]|uniref:2EXR domain-containing protein n=1 Tax=Coniochaeta ligniaria NRRL 30616 TaxID=1408157 RepID=A0A1J7I632_9PEZI|nr:hypothetical protein CONLIGDRAFT_143996 [Coniochaeta ligniaria NRRL 30616]
MSDDVESGGDYDLEEYESEDSLDSGLDDNGFFDMEAAESGADDDESDDDNPRPDWQPPLSPLPLESDYVRAPSSFPQFMRLPAELRHHIWSLFCPDLVEKSRVFEFSVVDHPTTLDLRYMEEGSFLQQQTAPARAVLATHRESRALALRTLPDTVPFRRGNGVVRFNKDKDVVYLNTSGGGELPSDITESVNYLAIRSDAWPVASLAETASSGDYIRMFLRRLPNLKAVYLHMDAFDCEPEELPWLKADKLNSYHYQTFEIVPGLGEDLDFIYCWPDIASDAVPLEEHEIEAQTHANGDDRESGTDGATVGLRRIPVFPLLQFDFGDAVDLFNRTMEWRRSGGELEWGYVTADDSGVETDEYESEGIDDNEIDADSQRSSEEEDDLAVLPPSEDEDDSDEGGNGRDHNSIASSDSEIGESEDGPSDLPPHSEYPVATFSSPEADLESSSTLEGSEPQSSSSEESPVRMVNRPKRRIVSSDVDDDSDGGPATMAERPSKRARVIMSDSEEDDED